MGGVERLFQHASLNCRSIKGSYSEQQPSCCASVESSVATICATPRHIPERAFEQVTNQQQ